MRRTTFAGQQRRFAGHGGLSPTAAVHVLAHLINAALGNVGKTVQFVEGHRAFGSIAELAPP